MNNRIRVFADLVSIDAWHDPIEPSEPAGVFVELAFRKGRLGGDHDDFPFTFALRLRRAEVIVLVSPPLDVVRSSIARSVTKADVRRTQLRTSTRLGRSQLAGKLSVSQAGLDLVGAVASEVSADESRTSTLEISDQPDAILIAGDPVDDRSYRWSLEPGYLDYLLGQPWLPVEQRRMDIVARSRRACADPSIRVELRCRLEDLVISDIVPKDPTLAQRVAALVRTDIRRKIAAQHIKHVLRHASLETGALDNRFSNVLLASVIAAAEGAT